MFCTIEDETGIANIVVWASLLERFRRAILGSSLMQVTGRLQRSPEGITHVIADRLHDRSALMAQISVQRRQLRSRHCEARSDLWQERVVPRSRDFHQDLQLAAVA